jgi:hypothetical protein
LISIADMDRRSHGETCNASKEVSVVGIVCSVVFGAVTSDAGAVLLILEGASYVSRGAAVAPSCEIRLRFGARSKRWSPDSEEESSLCTPERLFASGLPGVITVKVVC